MEKINQMKSHPMEWEKSIVNHMADKELIYSMNKEFLQLNNNNNKKITRLTNGHRT